MMVEFIKARLHIKGLVSKDGIEYLHSTLQLFFYIYLMWRVLVHALARKLTHFRYLCSKFTEKSSKTERQVFLLLSTLCNVQVALDMKDIGQLFKKIIKGPAAVVEVHPCYFIFRVRVTVAINSYR
jgi:hypothetical protein